MTSVAYFELYHIHFLICFSYKGHKQKYKSPKIQRLVTPVRLQRKRHLKAMKKRRAEKRREDAADYAKLLAKRMKEKREAALRRKRSSASLRESRASSSK